ncbi:endonuclease/exonuclease/phosphatase family protein [Polaribacter sp. Z022]|uniref:endonuclease/exonuclease/phosphatase family protein n=1 Tax=Polaribacter sp. Z022 TaxID=2927125 RepID=UPI00202004C5|nr:endonuclease/exonuclease/phosphatase family protein [Polaribacter sp. Z022]MCL7753433.1 endonuclease/exonuclease/phosphatase family protein [Polaribacter sp. Z022]
MKKLSPIDKLLYIINSLIATLLLLSYLLPYVSPTTIPVFAILSLFVPILLLINIAFVIYWLIKLKKQLLLSSFILLIGWFTITPFYKISKKNTSLNSDLKIMSYNVRMFNHWKWLDEENIENKISSFIKENDPDILTVQENMSNTKYMLDFPYKYIQKKYARGRFGMAIYSKLPIVKTGSLKLENTSNNIIFADIVRNQDTIRVYNLHLQSLNISPDKENFGQENSEKLIQRLKAGFKQQAEQTEIFLAHEKSWEGKKIVCGDFNNTAYSWVYNQISKNKKDAFIEAGKGFGKTFKYPFPMRIDFIFTDDKAVINQFNSYSVKYSDHYPILARVNWTK